LDLRFDDQVVVGYAKQHSDQYAGLHAKASAQRGDR
jgi:hypothetical protein